MGGYLIISLYELFCFHNFEKRRDIHSLSSLENQLEISNLNGKLIKARFLSQCSDLDPLRVR